MYYINTLKQELGIAKSCEHNLLDEKSVVDRHRCQLLLNLVYLLMRIISGFLRYTGNQNFIKDPISPVLLLTLANVLLLSCR